MGAEALDEAVAKIEAELNAMTPLPLVTGVNHTEVGSITVAPNELIREPLGDETPSTRPVPTSTLGVDDLVRRKRYRLSAPPAAARNAEVEVAPATPGIPASREASVGPIEKGWSDNNGDGIGDDNRGTRDAATVPVFRRYGRLGTGCTASMIDRRASGDWALTAAHCVYNSSVQPIWTTFQPGLGSSVAAGTWDVVQIFRYDYFVNPANNCRSGSTMSQECISFDIALLRVVPRAGATWPGGLTYATRTTATISAATPQKWHVGYAGCGSPGAPAGCSGNLLWGDNNPLSAGNFAQSDRTFRHSSDLNPGHSGGPMEIVESGVTKIFGVQSTETCNGTCTNNANQPRVNRARRIDNDWFTNMQTWIGP